MYTFDKVHNGEMAAILIAFSVTVLAYSPRTSVGLISAKMKGWCTQ
jgi:hypothetical protein